MPELPRIYSADQVAVTVNNHLVEGRQKGDFAAIEFQGEDYLATEGLDGAVIVAQMPNTVALVTITVLQGTNSAAILSAFRTAGRLPGFAGFSLGITDLLGGGIFSCIAAFPQNHPSKTYALEPGVLAFAFLCVGALEIEGAALIAAAV
jgi:hypothetical protein